MLQLTEWRRSEPLFLTYSERRVLERHFEAKIAADRDPELVRVTAGSVIGSFTVDTRTITVSPKIPIDRVLFMTAFVADPYRWQTELASLGRTNDLVLGLTRLFIRSADSALGRGLLRAYRELRADLPYVRGRVEWQRQARRALPVPLALAYKVHDDNVTENKIVRAALAVLRRLVGASFEDDVLMGLNRLWTQFREFDVLRDPLTALNRLSWTRHNEHYRPLLDLCRVVLENDMPELETGQVPVTGFTMNMPDLFERFVRRALEHYSGLSISTPEGRTLTLDIADRVDLHPDLAARNEKGWALVGDVKYKRDEGRGKNADLYQLLAYAIAAQVAEATLIYADGPVEPTDIFVRYADVNLHVLRLDLRESPAHVLSQLASIAHLIGTGRMEAATS
ncbi:MAG: McrC family protein [Actinomycetota bacterium]